MTALTDALTGLGNLQFIEQNMEEVLGKAGGEGQFFVIDIDNFRSIQSDLGVLFADEVICDIARMLCRMFQENSLIGKHEQDEFLLLIVGQRGDDEIAAVA